MDAHHIRILHVSDLHERVALDDHPDWRKTKVRADAGDRHDVLKAELPRVLQAIRNEGSIDLACFTGDVADWGLAEEFEQGAERIDIILEQAGVPEDRFFVIPGNHDVCRTQNPDTWKDFRDFLAQSRNPQRVSEWMMGGQAPPGTDTGWREDILERTSEFWNWVETGLGRPELLPENNPHGKLGYRHTIEDLDTPFPVHIIGLDSGWLSGDDNDDGKLLMTRNQINALARDRGVPLSGFRLALIHHPISDLTDQHEAHNHLSRDTDLVLRGHQHTPITRQHIDPDRDLFTLAAGCLFDGAMGGKWINGFQVVDAFLNDAGRPLRYDIEYWAWSDRGHWHRSNAMYKASENGRLTWWTPKGKMLEDQ